VFHDELKYKILDVVNREYREWISYREVFRSEKVVVGDYEGSFPKADLKLFIFFSGDFGVRIIDNLTNASGHCRSCGHLCIERQCKYGKYGFSEGIDGVLELPAPELLPSIIDNPYTILPAKIPSVDIVLATGLHNDLYLELPEILRRSDAEGLIVFRDKSIDAPLGVLKNIVESCSSYGIKVAAPKPSCSLKPNSNLIMDFIKQYRIGTPLVTLRRVGETISSIEVHVSAPCGITYYVARQLLGCDVKEHDKNWLRQFYDKIALHHHSYPCTGSMEYDYELGDTILHWSSYIERETYLLSLDLNNELIETINERITPKR
jgi:hypothetical protein